MSYIFNDILCYITSSIESKSYLEITNECVAYYNEEDIKKAKEEICSIAKVSPIWRRGPSRKIDNIKDICDIFDKYDRNELPTFVTKSHLAFPPCFGYEIIQNSIVSMAEQIADLKEELTTLRNANQDNKEILHNTTVLKEEIIELKSEISELKQNRSSTNLPVVENGNVTMSPLIPSSGRNQDEDRERRPLHTPPPPRRASPLRSYRDAALTYPNRNFSTRSPHRSYKDAAPTYASRNFLSRSPRRGNRMEERRSPGSYSFRNKENRDARNFSNSTTSYRSQQQRDLGIRGTGKMDAGNFCAVTKHYDIYVGRVQCNVSNDIIQSYVKDKLNLDILDCKEIESYYENRQSKSFKITATEEVRDLLLNADLWPRGVIVRKFTTKRLFR